MPSPQAQADEDLPADLDDLVAKALAGGSRASLGRLAEALQARPPKPAAPLPRPIPRGAPAPAVAAPSPADTGGLAQLEALERAAVEARQAWQAGRESAALAALGRARAALAALPGGSPAPPPQTPAAPQAPAAPATALPSAAEALQLPPSRQPWMLIVEGPGDPEVGARLAAALEVDRATGRQLALSRFPRVALRGEAAAPLEAAARRVRAQARLGAVVTSTRAMHGLGSPRTVLAAPDRDTVELTEAAAWLLDGPPPAGLAREVRAMPSVTLLVPGEVILRRFRLGRSGSRGRSDRAVVPATERRVVVLDLHGPTTFLRLVQGVTDLGALASAQHASRRSLQALVEHPPWPGARSLSRRTVQSVRVPPAKALEATGAAEVSAWPFWEEYTRQARLLAGLGPIGR